MLRRNLRHTLLIAATSLVMTVAVAEPAKMLVTEMEVTGDLLGVDLTKLQERQAKASEILRRDLSERNLYRIVTLTADESASITAHQHVHACNGCELELGRRAGADVVMVTWVYRVSQLILSLHVVIRNVHDGKTLYRNAIDFRNDGDEGWSRAVRYFVRQFANEPPIAP